MKNIVDGVGSLIRRDVVENAVAERKIKLSAGLMLVKQQELRAF